ncbi:Phox homologous domain [Pseudocohnilembus persalinus]|uniref:Phox homologous domain n=1 Tax=Pseudocohnilembus persalinus TaxID=266149 RepID=A0A0V0QF88_PSEPJ|nr:Phox homologous domain [Pseudocohnilembus persalinus]|eukprot:KRX00859.1 Phox homologous domain [Pseudocohnilembus persalinus]
MADEKEKKQLYLREQIMDKGYDAQQFLSYISEYKNGESGLTIENWTFEELQNIVQQFTNQFQPVCITNVNYDENQAQQEEEQQDELEDYDIELNNEIIHQPGNNNNNQQNNEEYDEYEQRFLKKFEKKLQDEGYEDEKQNQNEENQEEAEGFEQIQIMEENKDENPNDQQAQQEKKKLQAFQLIKIPKFQTTEEPIQLDIKCEQHVSTIPIYSKIKVVVRDPIKASSGLLGFQTHYSFKIVTKPYNWEVRRKMKDFMGLRNVLLKLFPAKIIPPLDTENTEQTQHQLNKRMKYLKSFIDDLKASPEIWSNEYVVNFLSLKDDQKFEKIMKHSEKEKEIQKIKDMANFTGLQKIRLTNSTYTYKEESQKYLNTAENTYKKLQLLSKQLKKDFEGTAHTLSSIGIAYHELFGAFNDFDSKTSEGKESHSKLKDSYVSFNNILMQWSKEMQQFQSQISDKMTHFFKFAHNEISCFKELHKKANDVENNYFKYKTSLNHKKEKAFKLDSSKWEIEKEDKEKAMKYKDNKEQIFKLMYKRDTKYEQYLREQFAFWTSTVASEFQRNFIKKSDDYAEFFKQFAKSQTNIINELLGTWGRITQDLGFENPFPIPRELPPGRLSVNLDDNEIIDLPQKQQE